MSYTMEFATMSGPVDGTILASGPMVREGEEVRSFRNPRGESSVKGQRFKVRAPVKESGTAYWITIKYGEIEAAKYFLDGTGGKWLPFMCHAGGVAHLDFAMFDDGSLMGLDDTLSYNLRAVLHKS
jgi:hypothetical protein